MLFKYTSFFSPGQISVLLFLSVYEKNTIKIAILYTWSSFIPVIDHCAEITCQNGGECINNREGFECDCADGWYGEHCEIDTE